MFYAVHKQWQKPETNLQNNSLQCNQYQQIFIDIISVIDVCNIGMAPGILSELLWIEFACILLSNILTNM